MSPENKYFNFERLDLYINGDNNLKKKLIEIFLKTAPEIIKTINNSYENDDLKQLSFFAHKLKSSIDIFNIKELKTDIRNLEKFGKEECNQEKIPELIDKLNNIIPKVVEQIRKENY